MGGVRVTRKCDGRTDGQTDGGNDNIPELSFESAGIINMVLRNNTEIYSVNITVT